MLLIGGHVSTRKDKTVSCAESKAADTGKEQKDSTEQGSGPVADHIRVLAFDCGGTTTRPRWYEVQVVGGANLPANRMAIGLTLKGTVLVVSGGYETDGTTARGKLLSKTDSWRLRFIE